MSCVRSLALASLAISLAACSGATPPPQSPAPAAAPARAPQPDASTPAMGPRPARVTVQPSTLTLKVGDTATVTAVVVDSAGQAIDTRVLFVSSNRRSLIVTTDGHVQAIDGGDYEVRALLPSAPRVRGEVSVHVEYPPVASLGWVDPHERIYLGAVVPLALTITDGGGHERSDVTVQWASSDPSIASIDRYGVLTAHRTGQVTLRASVDSVSVSRTARVVPNPVRTIRISVSADSARTGDVIHVAAQALDAKGQPVADAPILYSLAPMVADTLFATSAPAEIDAEGRFVAEEPGRYTVLATGPGVVVQTGITITARDVSQRVQLVGRGAVRDVHTSDLWIWQGADGRDYAVTGTWGANGVAYFWDVTDPAAAFLVDSVMVDARTVNDVKISEDGRVAVLTREGASNRKNGIVILDVSDPRNVQMLSTFDDELTGGVHNTFIYHNHVFAVNNGTRYDIIDISDPRMPHRVGRFELQVPGHRVHDVWVEDGIAYSSNWANGVVLVDVGNGVAGGTPEHPVEFASYKYPMKSTHAAFPYRSPTGKFYVFIGDEMFPYGLNTAAGGTPNEARGYIHIVDFTDPDHPQEVARYQVPEAGSHNLWVENDKLYVAFYNGGLRVVDVSGELKGNLYAQGREIARYMSYDPEGVIANAPFVWGPQPYKGNIFFTDWNSGLWTVTLEPREQPLTP